MTTRSICCMVKAEAEAEAAAEATVEAEEEAAVEAAAEAEAAVAAAAEVERRRKWRKGTSSRFSRRRDSPKRK